MSGVWEPAAEPPQWLTTFVAHVESAPHEWRGWFLPPPGGGVRQSAVLILFGPGPQGTKVVLTQRGYTLRSHPGQVSFPGGGREARDVSATGTALREAAEEIGLEAEQVRVLAELPALHIPISGYDVTPVIGWWHEPGRIWVRDPHEVEAVLTVAVADLLDPAARFSAKHPSGFTGPGFRLDSLLVWGFTAGVLDQIFDLAGLNQPWDDQVVRDVG